MTTFDETYEEAKHLDYVGKKLEKKKKKVDFKETGYNEDMMKLNHTLASLGEYEKKKEEEKEGMETAEEAADYLFTSRKKTF